MAETVYLYLKAGGEAIPGEVAQAGREGAIECVEYTQLMKTLRALRTGLATGRRQYEPLVFRKRIDKSSPLIARALVRNEVIEGVFKFFRPDPAGDGTTQQFFTVEIRQGRVAAQRQIVPDTLTSATAGLPPVEEVSFVFRNIRWSEAGGATAEDTWSPPAGVFS